MTVGLENSTDTNTKGKDGFSVETIKNALALRGKRAGCSYELLGKVVLVAFLVDDGESKWDKESEGAFVTVLKNVSERLMSDSGLNKKELSIAYAYCRVSVPYIVTRKNKDLCIRDVLRQFGYEDSQSYQKHYEVKFDRDEAALSFVFNKEFRSYATRITRVEGTDEACCPEGNEQSFVSFSKEQIAEGERTMIHELLHQFGAIDLYYPERVKFEAEKYLPDSIMNGGNCIDQLTRYVIGWDKELMSNARSFLQAIAIIPEEDLEYACKQEWLKTES